MWMAVLMRLKENIFFVFFYSRVSSHPQCWNGNRELILKIDFHFIYFYQNEDHPFIVIFLFFFGSVQGECVDDDYFDHSLYFSCSCPCACTVHISYPYHISWMSFYFLFYFSTTKLNSPLGGFGQFILLLITLSEISVLKGPNRKQMFLLISLLWKFFFLFFPLFYVRDTVEAFSFYRLLYFELPS